jgi:pimeloyl-ACP methyl ester carboxylesterase
MERTPFSVTTNDGQILACDRAGEGKVCILVHGLGFRRKHWHRQVQALVAAGFTAVTVDLRGFGDSPLPAEQYTIERLAQDLDSVRAQVGTERFHLIGHSMGGMVCMQYALAHPERLHSLTLASTTAHNGTRACQFGRMMSRLSKEGSGVALADAAFEAECRTMMDQVVQYVGVDDMMPLLSGLTADPDPARSLAWEALVGFSIRPRLLEISCPVFVMHGSNDPIMPYAAGFLIHLGLPGSRWLPFFEGGHNLPRENREAFNEGLLDFLGSVREEAAA